MKSMVLVDCVTSYIINAHLLYVAANSHGPLAVVNALGRDDIEIVDAYGKTREDEYLKKNPCHVAPMLEFDDGTCVWESNAIMRYLCNSGGMMGHQLYPSDLKKRAKIDMVMDWRQANFYPCLPEIGYIVFGNPMPDDVAQKKFKDLMENHFKVLTDCFLENTKFCFSNTPTIADLAVAPALTFIKARSKFWDAVPQKVKDYQKAVFEAFPDTAETFAILDGMATGFDGEGADLDPALE